MGFVTVIMILRAKKDEFEGADAGHAGVAGQAAENPEDEAEIFDDADETMQEHFATDIDRVDQDSREMEDLPSQFVRGEIDVKEQMDRTDARIIDASRQGHLDDEVPELPVETAADDMEDPFTQAEEPVEMQEDVQIEDIQERSH